MSTIAFFFRSKIQPVEALRWSSRRAVIGAVVLGLSFTIISSTFLNLFATFAHVLNTTADSPLIESIPKEGADSIFANEKVLMTGFDGTVVELPLDEDGFYTDEAREIYRSEYVLYARHQANVFFETVIDNFGLFVAVGLVTGAVSGAVIGGLSGRDIDLRMCPNQGIRQSGKNFVRIGLAYSVLIPTTKITRRYMLLLTHS